MHQHQNVIDDLVDTLAKANRMDWSLYNVDSPEIEEILIKLQAVISMYYMVPFVLGQGRSEVESILLSCTEQLLEVCASEYHFSIVPDNWKGELPGCFQEIEARTTDMGQILFNLTRILWNEQIWSEEDFNDFWTSQLTKVVPPCIFR